MRVMVRARPWGPLLLCRPACVEGSKRCRPAPRNQRQHEKGRCQRWWPAAQKRHQLASEQKGLRKRRVQYLNTRESLAPLPISSPLRSSCILYYILLKKLIVDFAGARCGGG